MSDQPLFMSCRALVLGAAVLALSGLSQTESNNRSRQT
jgi:hypothetical protein